MKNSLFGPFAAPLSGKAAKQLIVLLHGYGSNGDDLFGLVPELAARFPDAAFLSPNAPYPCEMNPFGGYQWFSMHEYTLQAMFNGAIKSAPTLNSFLDAHLTDLKLKPRNLALIGFSQGTRMALHVALRRPEPMAGVVGFSGALSGPDHLPKELLSKPPVCLIHGTADSVVPFYQMEAAQTVLRKNGVTVESHPRPGLPHSIDAEGIEIAVKFLKQVL